MSSPCWICDCTQSQNSTVIYVKHVSNARSSRTHPSLAYFLIFLYVQLFCDFYCILFKLCHFNNVLIYFRDYFCSNSCSRFVKSCIAPCSAVNSDCILKELETFSLYFVYNYTHLLSFASCIFKVSRSIYGHSVRLFVNKTLPSVSNS